MPYNNAPLPPPAEVTGVARLPVGRIRRIIQADSELPAQTPSNAVFTIAIAAEMFVQYLAQQSHQFAQTDRKPRRNVQYRDVANAVGRIDNLEFLADVVPKTMTYKHFRTVEAPSLREMWPSREGVEDGVLPGMADGGPEDADADPKGADAGDDDGEEDDEVDEGEAELEAEAAAEEEAEADDGELDEDDDAAEEDEREIVDPRPPNPGRPNGARR